MAVRNRILLITVVGLGVVGSLPAQEPARLGVERGETLIPRPQVSANQQVANTIAEHLRQSGQLRHYTINVIFEDGTAELNGTVTDQPQREEALRLVQGIPGVERVRANLTLTGSESVKQTQAMAPNLQEPAPLPRKAPEASAPPGPGGIIEPVPIFQAAPPGAYDTNQPKMPPYAWPTYAPYNNFSRVAYPQLYPYNSWPYIGPCYPFPKIPPGWRSVKLEWQDGHWWYSKHSNSHDWWRLRYW